ncbi:PTS sugar transporter subunit IIA [Lacticaseibacillus paracasei]|uniref:PTS sugar transporter subunit IIA n=1 Tax=Lacticaseibacillus paracasei TaxID=1597 RepID=UPI0031D9885E
MSESIENLIKSEYISLDIDAEDWQDSIRQSMQPLIKNKCILPAYVQACIDNIKRYGPYIVITKNVALAHAAVDKGVLKDAIGIGVLRNPIAFGNSANDPVKYIFSLSVIDSQAHLDAIAELAKLIENPNFLSLLKNSDDASTVMKGLHLYLAKSRGL